MSERITTTVINPNSLGVVLPVPMLDLTHSSEVRPTVVFRSEFAGEGDPILGDQLMAEYVKALLIHPEPPRAMLFYNSAIRLILEDSPLLEPIRQLASRGSEVLICRTSLQMLAPGQQPAVGNAAAMAELIDRMRQARLLLWP